MNIDNSSKAKLHILHRLVEEVTDVLAMQPKRRHQLKHDQVWLTIQAICHLVEIAPTDFAHLMAQKTVEQVMAQAANNIQH